RPSSSSRLLLPVAFLAVGQRCKERHDLLDGGFPVLPLPPARRLSGLEAVVTVSDPRDLDGRRQLVPRDLFAAPKAVALALQDDLPRLDRPEVLAAKLPWLPPRMKRVSQADQSRHACVVRDEARDPSAHRLAADDQPLAPEHAHDLQPRLP